MVGRRGLAQAILAFAIVTMPVMANEAAPGDAGQPGFLPVDEIVVPVADRGHLAGYVMLRAAIQFDSEIEAKSIQVWMPKIVDAWLRTMHGLSQRGHFRNAVVDPNLLKLHLLQAIHGILPQDDARDVLITTALFTRVP
jgi:hypothetical protein